MRGAHIEVFVSYSHDSRGVVSKVASLVARLRADGVECRIDQDVGAPQEGWEKWSRRAIAECDFTLIVCTKGTEEAYDAAATPARRRRGSRWEAHLICAELYRRGGVTAKFIPLIFSTADQRYIPEVFAWVQTHYNVSTAAGYSDLLTRLKPARGIRKRHAAPLQFQEYKLPV